MHPEELWGLRRDQKDAVVRFLLEELAEVGSQGMPRELYRGIVVVLQALGVEE